MVCKGQVKITTVMSTDTTKTSLLNVVEKTIGTYQETLTELVQMEVIYNDGTGDYVVDSASELGAGYRVYPCISATEKVNALMESPTDAVEWVVPLTEVTA